MQFFILLIFATIANGIDPSSRSRRDPFKPDNRILVKVPDDGNREDDSWERQDAGKFLRPKLTARKSEGRSRGPESVAGNA